jgi:leucyl aminopeptidase (aminopeptidase T)
LGAIEARILDECLGLGRGERFVVLTDEGRLTRARALYREAVRLGAGSTLVLQDPPVEGNELGPAAAAALGAADVIVSVLPGSISHSQATRAALANGARVVSMGGSTEEMLTRLLDADLLAVAGRSRRIAAALTSASQARITCPRGTHLELSLAGRTGVADDGDLRAPGSLGNMPFGEGFIAPTGGAGIVVPTTIAGQGRLTKRLVLELREGVLARAEGEAGRLLCEALDRHGPAGRSLAELGVGAHHAARITGDVLEDEKVLGSVHVAFGSSAAFGGDVAVPVHIDCVVDRASLWLDDRLFDVGRAAT